MNNCGYCVDWPRRFLNDLFIVEKKMLETDRHLKWHICFENRSRFISGSIVSDYGRSGFNPRRGQRIFPLNLCVQTGSGAHPASCTMGTGGPFPGGKSAAGA
jgi:hypothetical protein